MKTHHPVHAWSRHRWRAYHAGLMLAGTWHGRQQVLERRLARTLRAALAAGRTIIEAAESDRPIVWGLGRNCFAPPCKNDPSYLAEHIAARVIGFGWSVAVADTPD